MSRLSVFKRKSLYNGFLRNTLLILMIATVIITVALFFYSQSMIYKDLTSYLYSAQSEMCKSMDLIINDVNMASVKLLSREGLYQLIYNRLIPDSEKYSIVKQQLVSEMSNYDIIGEVVIISADGKVYKMSDDNYITLPDRAFLDGIDKSKTITYSDGIARGSNNETYIMIGRKFRNLDTGNTNGYLIIYLKSNNLMKIYNHVLINNSFSMLVNSNGTIMSSVDSENVGKTIFDYDYSNLGVKGLRHIDYRGEKMVVAGTSFSKQLKTIGFDWHILTYIKENSIQAITRQISYNVWIISAISAVIAIALSFLTVAYISKPLRRLQAAMKGFRGIRQNVQVSDRVYDEIGELEKAYVDMVNRIDELIIKNNEEKEKQRELELSALQAQINPHFLYNTLDAIVWLAKIKKQPDIEKITMALAKFFRLSLHKGDKFITVGEEISLVQSFVVIEQMRFPNQLDITYNIAEDIMDIYILKLILQPVVENALKHGIREKKENGKIQINGMRYEDMIIFEVMDNGMGFDPHMLDEYDNLDKSKSGGYGLKNVDERIKLEYGNKYGITIFSQPNCGTTVIIKVGIKTLKEIKAQNKTAVN
ncbi:cache domain-containing sensor histidine kinase [Clostridium thermarum]|uniref:cache domain-containing sensor histidine kinase n=1 Tax=Clostridium thermarum TaxID=1716543 RepID=UPI0013D5ADC8|nr:sensor histidine kinase [Clostridium thermarum]